MSMFHVYLIISGILVTHLLLLVLISKQYLPRDLLGRLKDIEIRAGTAKTEQEKLDALFGAHLSALGELKKDLGDRFDTLDLNQSKLNGSIAATDRLVAEMISLHRESATSADQLRSQVVNVANRLTTLELEVAAVKEHIDRLLSRKP